MHKGRKGMEHGRHKNPAMLLEGGQPGGEKGKSQRYAFEDRGNRGVVGSSRESPKKIQKESK